MPLLATYGKAFASTSGYLFCLVGVLLTIPLLSLPSNHGFIPYTYPEGYEHLPFLAKFLYGYLIILALPFDIPVPEPQGIAWTAGMGLAHVALAWLAYMFSKKAWEDFNDQLDALKRKQAPKKPNRTTGST